MALTILCISFLLFLVLGVPVAFAIGLSAVCTILYEGLPVAVVFQRMMSGMNVFSFLAIPFFIFAGELMLYGGIADKIVDFAKALVGKVRGGLGDDPHDEARRLRRRLRGQRDDARGARRRADADVAQHDHLFAGSRRQ